MFIKSLSHACGQKIMNPTWDSQAFKNISYASCLKSMQHLKLHRNRNKILRNVILPDEKRKTSPKLLLLHLDR